MAKIVNVAARARPVGWLKPTIAGSGFYSLYTGYRFSTVPRVTFPVRKPAIKKPIQRAPKAHPQIKASASSSSEGISNVRRRVRFRMNRPDRKIGTTTKIIPKAKAAKKPQGMRPDKNPRSPLTIQREPFAADRLLTPPPPPTPLPRRTPPPPAPPRSPGSPPSARPHRSPRSPC